MKNNSILDQAWAQSRAGARAGSGFRFQDAATVFAIVHCWQGELSAISVTPESLDDFSLEFPESTTWVQVKSKVDPKTKFSANEISKIIFSNVGEPHDKRVIFLDRPFLDYQNKDWNRSVFDEQLLTSKLLDKFSDGKSSLELLREHLQQTTIITISSPVSETTFLISEKLSIGDGAASCCATNLLHQVGLSSSENAKQSFKTKKSITICDVDRIISNTLDIIDPKAVDQAFRDGLIRPIEFHTPLEDLQFYEGLSTRPGHVAAGLVQPRDKDVDSVVRPLVQGRHVLVAGPSGSGKSALCYLSAFDTRHAFRWIETVSICEHDKSTLLRSLRAQNPTVERPLVVYVDNVGRGNEGIWEWLIEQSHHIPGLRILGSVREEDVGILRSLSRITVVRPKLSKQLAELIWKRLSELEATKAAYWKESFELSDGLMLEFVHILTQGGRLREIVQDQIRRRILEGRHDELSVLPLVAAAGMYGAKVSKHLLLEFAKISQIQFASAFLRLRNEHLIGIEHDGYIDGLHELRSKEIFYACTEQLVLEPKEIIEQVLYCVPGTNARRFITRSARDNVIDSDSLISAGADRLNKQPNPYFLTGILEALQLIRLDGDSETFKRIADKYNLSHREYMLAMMFLNPGLVETLSESHPVFSHLTAMTKKFLSERASDRRTELIQLISTGSQREIVNKLETPEAIIMIMTALHGLDINETTPLLLKRAQEVMKAANINDIAELLSIISESSPDYVSEMEASLGGVKELLSRLWRETPWSIKLITKPLGNGAFELEADLLAATPELINKPDPIIFEYAGRAIQLCSNAKTITSRPLQFSGETIEINGNTPGLKKLNRKSVRKRKTNPTLSA